MIVKLNRSQIFITGLIVILVYLLLNRVDYIWNSKITKGHIIGTAKWTAGRSSSFSAPVVRFNVDGLEIIFYGTTNTEMDTGQEVNVIYKISDPQSAEIYDFMGFWFSPLIYCLLPLIILTAAVYSFLTAKDIISIDFNKFFKKGTKPIILEKGRKDIDE